MTAAGAICLVQIAGAVMDMICSRLQGGEAGDDRGVVRHDCCLAAAGGGALGGVVDERVDAHQSQLKVAGGQDVVDRLSPALLE